jgi:hypothetical protein|tara:strand:- start:1825 stop:2544 length:720 start_codon:yes stop_codon:yes gene_type:complete
MIMLKHIVKKNPRFRPTHYVIFFTIVVFVAIWYLYDNPRFNAIRTQLSQAHDINLLLGENLNLKKQNKELRKQILKLERLANVDNETSIRLQNEIKSLQDKVFNLRRELTFYQGIITASSYSRGLNIQGLHIEATHKKGFFKYKLVLTNIGKSDKVAEVSVDMTVEGSDKSGFRTLGLNKISAGAEHKDIIKIRNFERVEGNLNLPDGFEPLRVLVDLKQHDGEKLRLHRVFEWRTGDA